MSKDNTQQFEGFVSDILNIYNPLVPNVDLIGETVHHAPLAALSCRVEQAHGDERTVIFNPRIILFIEDTDTDDVIEVDLTVEISLQSMHRLFKHDTVPVQLLLCQPSKSCVEAIIAHSVAKKIGYKVTVEEERRNNQVRFRIDLGFGSVLEALVDRNKVAKYFHWQPLTIGDTFSDEEQAGEDVAYFRTPDGDMM